VKTTLPIGLEYTLMLASDVQRVIVEAVAAATNVSSSAKIEAGQFDRLCADNGISRRLLLEAPNEDTTSKVGRHQSVTASAVSLLLSGNFSFSITALVTGNDFIASLLP
jgi:hypothetical protein